MKKIILALIVLIPFFGYTQTSDFNIDQIYPIDRGHSYVGFEIEYMGYAKVRGRFANFNGSFRYIDDDVTKSSVSVSIEVASIDTDNDFRDKDLRSDNWFNAEQFPNIIFLSTETIETDDGLIVKGKLTIKDVTKEIQIPMKSSGLLKDVRGDHQVIFTGTIVLNRKDYGVQGDNWSRIKEGITAVASEVKIDLSIIGKRIQEANFSQRVRNRERPHGLLYSIYKEDGLRKTLDKYDEMVEAPNNKINFNSLNIVGYMLLKEGITGDAEKILKRNLQQFPDNSNAYDSYAEALASNNSWSESRSYYEMALEKDPGNMNAKEVLKHM
jgi:polyisoprenoid-binding protein YceI